MKIILIAASFALLIFSCEKDSIETGYIIPKEELPDWLVTSIEQDEAIIESSPKYYLAWGAWIRSIWKKQYYYQYWNLLSSTIIPPISELGDTLDIPPLTSTDYHREHCCTEYVWKAPKYRDWMSGH